MMKARRWLKTTGYGRWKSVENRFEGIVNEPD